jgi:hypothetical protein
MKLYAILKVKKAVVESVYCGVGCKVWGLVTDAERVYCAVRTGSSNRPSCRLRFLFQVLPVLALIERWTFGFRESKFFLRGHEILIKMNYTTFWRCSH